jgi:hypothetical protein
VIASATRTAIEGVGSVNFRYCTLLSLEAILEVRNTLYQNPPLEPLAVKNTAHRASTRLLNQQPAYCVCMAFTLIKPSVVGSRRYWSAFGRL